MKQKSKIAVLCALLASSLAAVAQSNMIDGVVWVVGDNAIMRSDVEEQRMRLQYEGQRLQGDPYCVIPERIALQKLFLHQAKIDSVEASESQVEMQVNMRMDHFLREIGSKEKLEEYFKKTTSEIKEEMRQTIADQMTIQMEQQKITGDIKLTPAEVREFCESLPADSVPMVPAAVEVQIITLEPPIPQEDLEATKSRLREYAERVNNGSADFSMLARLYSDDPGTASKGGELGFLGVARWCRSSPTLPLRSPNQDRCRAFSKPNLATTSCNSSRSAATASTAATSCCAHACRHPSKRKLLRGSTVWRPIFAQEK